jgi:hypothetical protein
MVIINMSTAMRHVVTCLIALALFQSSVVAQTDACTEEHAVFVDGQAMPEPLFEPIAGDAEAWMSPAYEDFACDDVLAATDIATPVTVDSTPLQDDQAHYRQSAAYYELRLLVDAAFEDRGLLTRFREVAPKLTQMQRYDIFERGRKTPTAWAVLLNVWPIPMLGSMITGDWAGVGYFYLGALIAYPFVMPILVDRGYSDAYRLYAAPGLMLMAYAACRPLINTLGISRFNSDLRDALGIASTAMLELAPVLVPSMASQFTPGVGLHLRF